MSKSVGKSLKQVRSERVHPPPPINIATRWVSTVLSWPRLLRMGLVTVFTLAAVAAVFPLVDSIYIAQFFTEETRILPSLVTLVIGIMMYAAGWWLVIGMPGDTLPLRRALYVYLLLGLLLVIVVLILLAYGYYVATLPDA